MKNNYEHKVFRADSKTEAEKILNEKSGIGWEIVDLKINQGQRSMNHYDNFFVIMRKKVGEFRWFWKKEADEDWGGPVGWERLVSMVENGELENNSLVWQENFDRWKQIDSVARLADRLPSSTPDPPPIPGRTHTSEGKDVIKLSESEALSCIHDYDEDEQGREYCTKCGWYRHSLKSIDS